MAKQNINSKQGFTIIEVVLVLAIAGLIFLMVFVALPALQRSQRDTARRNDLSRVDTSLVQYQTNNQSNTDGQLPKQGAWEGKKNFDASGCGDNSACQFVRQYMNSGSGNATTNEFLDPSGEPYSVVITENLKDNTSLTTIKAKTGAKNTLTGSKTAGYTVSDTTGSFDEHTVYIIPGAECNGTKAVASTASNHFAVLSRLEGAGVYCIDDQ